MNIRRWVVSLMLSAVAFAVIAGCSFSGIDDAVNVAKGSVVVNSTESAKVYIDEIVAGDTNSAIGGITPGERRIQVKTDGGTVLMDEKIVISGGDLTELYVEDNAADEGDGGTAALPDLSISAAEPQSWEKKADAVIGTAKSLIPIARYAHKYDPPKYFDCSGFTYYCFLKNGVNLGTKDDDKQVKLGSYVSKSNLRKGDLVFFYSTVSGPGNIGHVGIYMGNDQFIHIYSSGKPPAISRLNGSPWWKTHYITARRIIK